jgi:hypothetical protein
MSGNFQMMEIYAIRREKLHNYDYGIPDALSTRRKVGVFYFLLCLRCPNLVLQQGYYLRRTE